MKKVISLILALSLCFGLCACAGGSQPVNSGKDTGSNTAKSPVSAQDYYRYINEQLLTDTEAATGHLAKTEALEVPFNYSGAVLSVDIGNKGGLGLLSAIVEDFDSDGCLEMLAICAEHMNMLDTVWKGSLDDNQPYDMDDSVLAIRGYLFDYENGEIYRRNVRDISFMQNHHFGRILVGIEKIQDAYYIFSDCNSENLSTYGVRPYTVTKLGEEGLYMVYCSPLDLGNLTQGNTLDKLNISNPMDITHSSLSDLPLSLNDTAMAEDAHRNLGQRLMCFVSLDYTDWGGDSIVYTATDYTLLRSYLPDNGSQWQPIVLPEGQFYEKPQTDAVTEALTAKSAAAAGVTFSVQNYSETDGIPTMECATEQGYMLTVQCHPETHCVVSLSLHTSNSPQAQWYAIKDAILSLEELALTADQIAPLKGERVNIDYMSGKQVGNWTISSGAAGSSTWFRVSAN